MLKVSKQDSSATAVTHTLQICCRFTAVFKRYIHNFQITLIKQMIRQILCHALTFFAFLLDKVNHARQR